MDRLIPHLSSGELHVLDRWRLRTTASELNDLDLPDFTLFDCLFYRCMAGVEAPVETKHHRNAGFLNRAHRLLVFLVIGADRLFTINGLSGVRRTHQII